MDDHHECSSTLDTICFGCSQTSVCAVIVHPPCKGCLAVLCSLFVWQDSRRVDATMKEHRSDACIMVDPLTEYGVGGTYTPYEVPKYFPGSDNSTKTVSAESSCSSSGPQHYR